MVNKLRILVLEDDAARMAIFMAKLGKQQHDVMCVDTAEAAIALIKAQSEQEQPFDVLFLDHDLGGETFVDITETNTGSEVVRFLVGEGYKESPTVIVHSLNTPAAEHMEFELTYAGFTNYRIPFTRLKDQLDDPRLFSL